MLSDSLLLIWMSIQSRLTRDERGQTTSEYALVMLAAAAVAGLVLAWATKSHAISDLFDSVISRVLP
jgi:Flp pilus assembly pilin Flp